jgi:hypothetical protein
MPARIGPIPYSVTVMSGGRGEGARDVSAGAGAGPAAVSAAFSVFTAHADAANRNAMERRIVETEINGSFEIEGIILR